MKEEWIKPYGDTLNDGIVQLSFTLPVEYGERARKAAEIYMEKLNFEKIIITHAQKIAEKYTYFVVYARAKPELDYSTVKATKAMYKAMSFNEINEKIRKELKRPLSVVGACIGSDAHTVGIDGIMNMKGYNQDYGLERYPWINAFNMGAQVSCEALVKKAVEMEADAILVSQTVTKGDSHVGNFSELIKLLKANNLAARFILIAGGPGITHEFAVRLGYGAGFGRGTLPSQVASFIVGEILNKNYAKT